MRGLYPEARFAGMFLEELQAPCGQRRVSKGEGGGWKMRLAGGQGGPPRASQTMWAFRLETSCCPSSRIRSRLQTDWRLWAGDVVTRGGPAFS